MVPQCPNKGVVGKNDKYFLMKVFKRLIFVVSTVIFVIPTSGGIVAFQWKNLFF